MQVSVCILFHLGKLILIFRAEVNRFKKPWLWWWYVSHDHDIPVIDTWHLFYTYLYMCAGYWLSGLTISVTSKQHNLYSTFLFTELMQYLSPLHTSPCLLFSFTRTSGCSVVSGKPRAVGIAFQETVHVF